MPGFMRAFRAFFMISATFLGSRVAVLMLCNVDFRTPANSGSSLLMLRVAISSRWLTRTTSVYEQKMPAPWSYDRTDPEIDMMLGAIVGFRIEINRLEGKAKLNQNHPEERRRKVIRSLETQGDDDSQAIARLMTASLKD